MSPTRVLRIYHSGVVDEYRERERMLQRMHGYDVHLVCPPAWPEGGRVVTATEDSEVATHIVPVRGRQHPILFWYSRTALRRAIRRVNPQIVDLQEEPYSLAVAGALRAVAHEAPAARVCVYTAQNINKRYPPPFRQLEARALRRAAAAYPCSREAGEVLRGKGFRGSLHVIPLGVSLGIAPRDREHDHPRVGFVGRLEPYKGGEHALRAFALATEGLAASLEILGSGSEEQRLAALARELGIADRVDFVGAVPQDRALERIAGYDALLVPSLTTPKWKEQFGRVAAQAMATGTPVIAFDSGSLPELLAESGEIVAEGDVHGMANRLRLLLLDPTRRSDLATKGRARAEEYLTWERVASVSSHVPAAARIRERRAHASRRAFRAVTDQSRRVTARELARGTSCPRG